jgi:hypothetical protein
MRAALPTVGALLLALGLTACHKPVRNADVAGASGSPAAKTLTIQNGERRPMRDSPLDLHRQGPDHHCRHQLHLQPGDPQRDRVDR